MSNHCEIRGVEPWTRRGNRCHRRARDSGRRDHAEGASPPGRQMGHDAHRTPGRHLDPRRAGRPPAPGGPIHRAESTGGPGASTISGRWGSRSPTTIRAIRPSSPADFGISTGPPPQSGCDGTMLSGCQDTPWFVLMLPQIDQQSLYNQFNFHLGTEGPSYLGYPGYFANSTIFGTTVSSFQCPSDRASSLPVPGDIPRGAVLRAGDHRRGTMRSTGATPSGTQRCRQAPRCPS